MVAKGEYPDASKGNRVKIPDSTRCCKFRNKSLCTKSLEARSEKTYKPTEQVRRPAVAASSREGLRDYGH